MELLPAVSLYHRDDCISLVPNDFSSSSTSSSASTSSTSISCGEFSSILSTKEYFENKEAIRTYVRYTQTLCSHINEILVEAQKIENLVERSLILSHPFLARMKFFLPL